MSLIQVRIDEELKQKAKILAESMGMTLSGAIKLLLSQMVAHNGIPFAIKPSEVAIKTKKTTNPVRKQSSVKDSVQKTETITNVVEKGTEKTKKSWNVFTPHRIGS